MSLRVHSYSLLSDGAADHLSKSIKQSVNRFLEMSGWVPSSDIFNLLDRWTEEGFQLLGGEAVFMTVRTVFSLYGSVAKDPSLSSPPVYIPTSSFAYLGSQFPSFLHLLSSHFSVSSFVLASSSNSEESLISVSDPNMLSAPYPCISGERWLGGNQWLLCFCWRQCRLPLVPKGFSLVILPELSCRRAPFYPAAS